MKMLPGIEVRALVDTGASCNVVSEHFANKYNLWSHIKSVRRAAVSASGHALSIIGVLSISLWV
jgi:predicted aspartyl protease